MFSWSTQRVHTWGKEKTVEYAKKLATEQLRFISGHTQLADAVARDETREAVNVFQHWVEQQKAYPSNPRDRRDRGEGSSFSGATLRSRRSRR